jgi:hypothetical protein
MTDDTIEPEQSDPKAELIHAFFDRTKHTKTHNISPPGRFPSALLRRTTGDDTRYFHDLRQSIDLYEYREGISPLFVSYYTPGPPYEPLADQLRRSLDRLNLPHRIERLDSCGTWVANTGQKAAIVQSAWDASDGPVCWVDADAEVLRAPEFLFANPFDIACVRRNGWYDISSFVYFAKTPAAGAVIRRWVALCADNPTIWDQVLLSLAWYQTAANTDMAALWLHDGMFRFPRPWIRDLRDRLINAPLRRKMRPFIDQKQASRIAIPQYSTGKSGGEERGSDDIGQAFRTALVNSEFDFVATIDSIFNQAPT